MQIQSQPFVFFSISGGCRHAARGRLLMKVGCSNKLAAQKVPHKYTYSLT
jgi:hypothetical protein